MIISTNIIESLLILSSLISLLVNFQMRSQSLRILEFHPAISYSAAIRFIDHDFFSIDDLPLKGVDFILKFCVAKVFTHGDRLYFFGEKVFELLCCFGNFLMIELFVEFFLVNDQA